jgi:hypothetical protein
MRFFALALIAPALAMSTAASAQEPTAVVRGYFAALEKKDFGKAMSLTQGAAQQRTADMVGELQQQAAQHNAQVELKVQKLDVKPSADDHVTVDFAIDVIGKKWFIRKVAKKLSGKAQFKMDRGGDQIVSIDGNLLQ